MTQPDVPNSQQARETFVVSWNPVPTANRVAHLRKVLRMTIWRSLVSPIIVAVLWLVSGRTWSTGSLVALLLISVLFSAGWIGLRWWQLRSAQKALALVPRGIAMQLDRHGISGAGLDGQQVSIPWEQTLTIKAEGHSTGTGPDFVVSYLGGQLRLPLSFLDSLPGTIDSALRAYSSGRRGLDLSGLDSVW